MSELRKAFVGRNDLAEGASREPLPDRAVYEPPQLRAVGTLAELVRGVSGATDGLGPGSALDGESLSAS